MVDGETIQLSILPNTTVREDRLPTSPFVKTYASESTYLWRFSQFFAYHRCAFGILSFIFLVCTTLLSLFLFRPPDLRDPSADFVTIGTAWSARVEQYKALLAETSELPIRDSSDSSGIFPSFTHAQNDINHHFSVRRIMRSTPVNLSYLTHKDFDLCLGGSEKTVNLWKVYSGHSRIVISLDSQPSTSNSPKVDFLTDPNAFLSLCQLQDRISSLDAYKQECLYSSTVPGSMHQCCPIWSLPNMLQALFHANSCESLVPRLQNFRTFLMSCLPSFRDGTLRRSCWNTYGSDPTLLCPLVEPQNCLQSPLIPLILATSLPDNVKWENEWRATLFQLPLRRSNSLSVYTQLEAAYQSGNLTDDLPVPLYLQGMYLHSYNELVSEFLIRDVFRLAVGLSVLLLLVGLITCSFSFPFVALFGIGWSLLIAYTLYTRVLCVQHFPVINFMAIVLLIGLGIDDLLLYYQVWNSHNPELCATPHVSTRFSSTDPHRVCCSDSTNYANSELTQQTIKLYFTLVHAVPSMIMTTISTIMGLAVNFLSSIVAVQRFSLFTILAVFCNLVYVLCSAPAVFIFLNTLNNKFARFSLRLRFPPHRLSPQFSGLLIRTRFFIFFLFVILVCFSFYQLFVQRCFTTQRSSNSVSSFFSREHPFEVFLTQQSDLFWVERNLHFYSHLLAVHFVWGIQPADSRSLWSYAHDADAAKWLKTSELNFTSVPARNWLYRFCDIELRQMPHLLPYHSPSSYHSSTLASFSVSELNPHIQFPIWCPLGRFPYSLDDYVLVQACYNHGSLCCPNGYPLNILSAPSSNFSRCLEEYLVVQSHHFIQTYPSGYRFASHSMERTPVAFILTALLNVSLTNSTRFTLDDVVSKVSYWFQDKINSTPASLGVGHLVIPALTASQVTANITEYVYWSILGAVLMATVLVLVSSGNVCLSFLAFASLVGCLLFTITILALFDHWELGLVEGLVISLASGLAIDPCLHLAFSLSHSAFPSGFRFCQKQTCVTHLQSIQNTLTLLNPAVTGSTWSTAIAGFCMIGSNLLCYHQIGVFLATLMTSSWLFCYIFYACNIACASNLMPYFRSVL